MCVNMCIYINMSIENGDANTHTTVQPFTYSKIHQRGLLVERPVVFCFYRCCCREGGAALPTCYLGANDVHVGVPEVSLSVPSNVTGTRVLQASGDLLRHGADETFQDQRKKRSSICRVRVRIIITSKIVYSVYM